MRSNTQLLSQLPRHYLLRRFGWPKVLPFNYTLLISTKCNSRCWTCQIWKQKHQELNLKEWKKVLKSLGNSPFWVTVSGGEPFLQPHLTQLVILIDKICQPAIINIPTNSLLGGKIADQVEVMVKKIKAHLVINLSLDGVGKDHDRIRGVKGNFSKVLENYHHLKKLQKKYPRLTVGFGTVVSRYNLKAVEKVFDLAFQLEPDQYVTELAEERVELNNFGSSITPTLSEFEIIIEGLLRRMKQGKFKGLGKVSRAFRFEYYHFVKNWLSRKKLLPDYAGFASCQITSWGEVWPSCIKGERMGNLKEVDFNFAQVWFSKEAGKIRKKIKKEGTSYPLANAFYSSALFHLPTMVRVLRRLVLE